MSQKKTISHNSHKEGSTKSKVSKTASPKTRKANSLTTVRSEKRAKESARPSVCLEEGVAGDVQAKIAERAHELFEQRGGTHGYDREDWLKAELQILGEMPQF